LEEDSVAAVWIMESRTLPGGVDRRTRGWLHRGGTWDPFYADAWQSPPTRVPWRIVPHGPLRIVAHEGDAIQRLFFEAPPRSNTLALGDVLIEWAGVRGEALRLQEAQLGLPGTTLRGTLADVSRHWRAEDTPPGDWALLVSGDSLQVLVAQNREGEPETRAWARWSFRDLQWPQATLRWTGVRAFEPARRDVPAEWSITTEDGDFSAQLRSRSASLDTNEGAGPVLPVGGLFIVEGTVELSGQTLEVYGLLRHRQS